MLESFVLAQAAAAKDAVAPSSLTDTLSRDAAGIANVPGDIAQLPFLQHMAQAMPAADVAFGGGMLMLIILIHATGVRAVTDHVARRSRTIMLRPKVWRADVLMATSVLLSWDCT